MFLAGHAATPIVLAEGTPAGADWGNPNASATSQGEDSLALRHAYDTLVANGDTHLYYAPMYAAPVCASICLIRRGVNVLILNFILFGILAVLPSVYILSCSRHFQVSRGAQYWQLEQHL